jgi:hypothetical protein
MLTCRPEPPFDLGPQNLIHEAGHGFTLLPGQSIQKWDQVVSDFRGIHRTPFLWPSPVGGRLTVSLFNLWTHYTGTG